MTSTSTPRPLLAIHLLVVAGYLATGLAVGGTGATIGTIGSQQVVNGLLALLGANHDEVCGLGIFNGECFCGHELECWELVVGSAYFFLAGRTVT